VGFRLGRNDARDQFAALCDDEQAFSIDEVWGIPRDGHAEFV
jgi:hypothetical protein